ncbi:unnamed protein product, partial [marine sediment metagenome]
YRLDITNQYDRTKQYKYLTFLLMLMNSRPREGAKEATFREAIFLQTFSKDADLTISISSKIPSAKLGSCGDRPGNMGE